jgi:hypothetical protein
MPFYRVLLEGNGLCIDSSDEAPPIAGFFTTRVVWAKAAESAGRAAIDLVAREWRTEPYVSQSGAASLSLAVSECAPVGFIHGLISRPSGFSFFSAEE